MGFVDFVKNRFSGEVPQREAVGTIVEGPTSLDQRGEFGSVLCFRLDTLPDVEFHQVVSPLAPVRKKGDRVKVHYHEDKGGDAVVDWCEAN
jgi:hypothetical protein